MANIRSGNSWYVDVAYTTSADDLALKNIIVTGIIVTATGASGRIQLSDITTPVSTKVDLRVAANAGATGGDSRFFDFSNSPLTFSQGIRVTALSSCVATLIGIQGVG